MAFQSSVFRDGQWVTETVNLNDALKASAAQPSKITEPQDIPPDCGLVSRTLLESPIVHWALSVRIRSKSHNDIVFVGDHFVQVYELHPNGQMLEVVRKNDFGARIRHAVVFGHSPQDLGNDGSSIIKPDDADSLMGGSAPVHGDYRSQSLPPQMLVIMLDTGDTMFLFARERVDGLWEICAVKQKRPNNLKYLGFHLAIDPSSRYLAAGSAQGAVLLYELETLEQLSIQYQQHGSFNPVKAVRARAIAGIVCQLAFLHPQPTLDDHVILLLMVCQGPDTHGRIVTRMATFQWRRGDDLQKQLSESPGIRLPDDHRLPLTLIPLTCQSAFLTVTKDDIILVKSLLAGSPQYEVLPIDVPPSTRLFHGTGEPLWTCWTRPPRLERYLERTDIIYVGREDGVIIHVEIEAEDLLTSATYVGSLDTNITTAFTSAFDVFSDVLIIAGDSGPGGIWKLPARSDLEYVSSIPNWSPVVDVTTTREIQPATSEISTFKNFVQSGATLGRSYKQDRVFTTSGRRAKSAVTELRRGIQARIGFDIDLDQPIRQSWMFQAEIQGQAGFYVLLSLADSSCVLQFSEDLSGLAAAESAPFDASSRTLYASKNTGGIIVQVTEIATTLVAPSQSSRHPHDQTSGLENFLAESASCLGDLVAVSGYDGQVQKLLVLGVDQMNVSQLSLWDIEPSTTCISLFGVQDNTFIAAGSKRGNELSLTIYSLQGETVVSQVIGPPVGFPSLNTTSQVEAFTSICVFYNVNDTVCFVCGTRSGHLVTAKITKQTPEVIEYLVEHLGTAPSYVSPTSSRFYGKSAVIAWCYRNSMIMTDFCQGGVVFKTKTCIWPTDARNPSMPSPPISSMFCLDRSLSGHSSHMSVTIGTGSRLLVADILPQIGAVPRSIPLEGTPMRIVYSHTWECLIVAHVGERGCPVLSFIDPDTGASIGMATDKDGNPVGTISGLDHEHERVSALYEWCFKKDGEEFPFLIVATIGGRLLVVSVAREPTTGGKKFRYWTRLKRGSGNEPIYSVAGDANEIVYCSGTTLHLEVLDTVNKKLKEVKEYRLESIATSLRMADGKVWALTTSHSLQILDLHIESDPTPISVANSDQVARFTTHLVEMADTITDTGEWPIDVVSTEDGGIAGLWIPFHQREKELALLFEGKLNTPVRRFVKGHTRPVWVHMARRRKYDSMYSTTDGAEVLGVSLDGTLMHFTLIGPDLWRFLRLILNLARYNAAVFPCTYMDEDEPDLYLEPEPDVRSKHIDGDALQRCLDHRVLDDLASVGNGDGIDLICEYLDGIQSGAHTREFEEREDRRERYIELAYALLEHVLAPVL